MVKVKRVAIPKRRSKPRRGPMRDPKYRKWLSMFGWCVVCWPGKSGGLGLLHDPLNPIIDPAHTQNNGMRSKGPDSSCVPLCRRHHQQYDSGRIVFETYFVVDMKKKAAEWYAAYLEQNK